MLAVESEHSLHGCSNALLHEGQVHSWVSDPPPPVPPLRVLRLRDLHDAVIALDSVNDRLSLWRLIRQRQELAAFLLVMGEENP